jgi:predicted transcriptional regulator
MKVVLSIKPEFVNKIFDGTKRFEFRKAIFKNENIKTVIVYASSPVQKVIGEFEIERIINHDIDTLWGMTENLSGITKDYFYQYFEDRKAGYAIQIKAVRKYKKPKDLKADFNLVPPQSFAYYQT